MTLLILKLKNPIKTNGGNHHIEDQREGQKEVKRCIAQRNQRRERASSSHGRKLFHPQPF